MKNENMNSFEAEVLHGCYDCHGEDFGTGDLVRRISQVKDFQHMFLVNTFGIVIEVPLPPLRTWIKIKWIDNGKVSTYDFHSAKSKLVILSKANNDQEQKESIVP